MLGDENIELGICMSKINENSAGTLQEFIIITFIIYFKNAIPNMSKYYSILDSSPIRYKLYVLMKYIYEEVHRLFMWHLSCISCTSICIKFVIKHNDISLSS